MCCVSVCLWVFCWVDWWDILWMWRRHQKSYGISIEESSSSRTIRKKYVDVFFNWMTWHKKSNKQQYNNPTNFHIYAKIQRKAVALKKRRKDLLENSKKGVLAMSCRSDTVLFVKVSQNLQLFSFILIVCSYVLTRSGNSYRSHSLLGVRCSRDWNCERWYVAYLSLIGSCRTGCTVRVFEPLCMGLCMSHRIWGTCFCRSLVIRVSRRFIVFISFFKKEDLHEQEATEWV